MEEGRRIMQVEEHDLRKKYLVNQIFMLKNGLG